MSGGEPETAELGESAAPGCEHDGCITCGDAAIAMVVLRLDRERGLALCETVEGDGRETVEIALVAPVRVGALLLVHAGTAIAGLPPEGAP